jgi:hypothetical protein
MCVSVSVAACLCVCACVCVCAYVCECECECHCECEYMCACVSLVSWQGGVGVLERVLRVQCLPLFRYVFGKIQDGV